MTATEQTASDKDLLTYSALNIFRNCPRKYKHRYLDFLRPREKAEALSFGGVIHEAIELWYRSLGDANRLWTVLESIDQQFPLRIGDDVQKALLGLPYVFREAVVLCDVVGLSYDEIAAAVAAPVGTVRSRIHRGRKMMREALS